MEPLTDGWRAMYLTMAGMSNSPLSHGSMVALETRVGASQLAIRFPTFRHSKDLHRSPIAIRSPEVHCPLIVNRSHGCRGITAEQR